jgi:YNFM family putative membrane transporter
VKPENAIRLFQWAAFTSAFDRLMIAPLLIVIAVDLDLTVATATVLATANLVAYGLMQLVWALLSDRFGRIRMMRLALAMASVAGVAAAISVNLETLVVARALAGASFAAALPGALVYIGDTVPASERPGPLSDLMRGTAVGSAAAALVAGAIGALFSWRVAFAGVGLIALVLAWRLGRVTEPELPDGARPMAAVVAVVRDRWALLVLFLALGEGFVLLSVLNFLPAAIQSVDGTNTAVAGAVVAVYGVAVLFATPVVKRRAASAPPSRLVLVGGTLTALGLAAFVIDHGIAGVLVGCFLLGAGWAFMHTTLQAWATDVVPHARAAAVSLFATVLFTGSAAGTFVGGRLIADGEFTPLFTAMLLLGIPLVAVAWTGRRRFAR